MLEIALWVTAASLIAGGILLALIAHEELRIERERS